MGLTNGLPKDHVACVGASDVLTAAFTKITAVIACDTRGRVVYSSPGAARILGIDAIDKDFVPWATSCVCYRPDMVTRYPGRKMPFARAMRGKELFHQLIHFRNAEHPFGLWMDVSGTPLLDGLGKVHGGLLVFSDVSILENLPRNEVAVKALLAAKQHPCEPIDDRHDDEQEGFASFRALYPQLSVAAGRAADSIQIADNDGVIEYVNPAFEALTGFSASEVLGQRPDVCASGHHNAAFSSGLWSTLGSGDSFHGVIINRKKNGDLFWCYQTIDVIKDGSGAVTHVVSVMRDLTALRKQHEQEFYLKLARELQQRYHQITPSLPGFDIAAAAYLADETGGDYYDFIAQEDGSLYVVLADIAGHGFGSFLVMAEVRASLRAYAGILPDISSLFKHLNRSLLSTLGHNRFITMFVGRIDPHRRSLEYISAGHVPGFLLSASGHIRTVLHSTGQPLGLFPDPQFDPARIVFLKRGDTIMLLTDGITESMDASGAMFGTAGAVEYLRSQRRRPASELVHGLYDAARAFTGGARQMDDMASVVCKVR